MPRRTHELITRNLALEPLLRSIQRRGTARPVFSYANEVIRVNREWRITERPVFMLMEELDSASRELKVLDRHLSSSPPRALCEIKEGLFFIPKHKQGRSRTTKKKSSFYLKEEQT